MTNYPNGIAAFGFPVFPALPGGPVPSGPSSSTSYGNGLPGAWFVSSVVGSNGNTGLKMNAPLSTLVYAISVAKPGDTIYLLPGHTENLVAANHVDVATANLSVVGLGSGNQRALLVFKTLTTATFRVNATTGDGFYLYNVRFQSQVAAHALAFNVAAKDCTFDAVDFYDDGTNDCTTGFQVTGVNCTIKNCFWTCEIANASTLAWITLNAAQGFRCYNCYGQFAGKSSGNPANGVIVGVTTLTKHVDIRGNFLSIDAGGTGSIVISLLASSTGLVAYNNLNSTGKTAIAGICAIANAKGFQNFVTHTANKSGLLDPVVDA